MILTEPGARRSRPRMKTAAVLGCGYESDTRKRARPSAIGLAALWNVGPD
jgi:hypothetical protein